MNSPADFPISVEQVVFLRTVVLAVPAHQPTMEALPSKFSPQNSIDIRQDELDGKRYFVTMNCKFNEEQSPEVPYSLDIECMGVFRVDETLEADAAKRAVAITGHGVVFGAIREAVAWITSRHVFGPLTLGLSVLNFQPPPGESKS